MIANLWIVTISFLLIQIVTGYKDPFSVLGISRQFATKSTILQAYRAKSLEFHPDKNRSPDAPGMFVEVTKAKEEAMKRIKYPKVYADEVPWFQKRGTVFVALFCGIVFVSVATAFALAPALMTGHKIGAAFATMWPVDAPAYFLLMLENLID